MGGTKCKKRFADYSLCCCLSFPEFYEHQQIQKHCVYRYYSRKWIF